MTLEPGWKTVFQRFYRMSSFGSSGASGRPSRVRRLAIRGRRISHEKDHPGHDRDCAAAVRCKLRPG